MSISTLLYHFKSARSRRYFICQWGARCAVASLVADRLVVHVKFRCLFFCVSALLGSCFV